MKLLFIGDKFNSVVFDYSKVKRFVPDYACEVDWVESVRRSLAWFEAHLGSQTIGHEMNSVSDHILAANERAFSQYVCCIPSPN